MNVRRPALALLLSLLALFGGSALTACNDPGRTTTGPGSSEVDSSDDDNDDVEEYDESDDDQNQRNGQNNRNNDDD